MIEKWFWKIDYLRAMRMNPADSYWWNFAEVEYQKAQEPKQ